MQKQKGQSFSGANRILPFEMNYYRQIIESAMVAWQKNALANSG
jgi:hypothetical protein